MIVNRPTANWQSSKRAGNGVKINGRWKSIFLYLSKCSLVKPLLPEGSWAIYDTKKNDGGQVQNYGYTNEA